MKSTPIIKSLLALALASAIGLGSACAKDKEKDEAALAAQAKITKADAEKTALASVTGGTVKDAEIEKEKGVLIWSVEITTPGSTDVTEVNVDATTGKIVGTEVEKKGAKEADEEKD